MSIHNSTLDSYLHLDVSGQTEINLYEYIHVYSIHGKIHHQKYIKSDKCLITSVISTSHSMSRGYNSLEIHMQADSLLALIVTKN